MVPLQGEKCRQLRPLANHSSPQVVAVEEGAEEPVRGRPLAVRNIFAVLEAVDQRILDSREHQKIDSESAVSSFDVTVAVSMQDRGENPLVCFENAASTIAMTSVA